MRFILIIFFFSFLISSNAQSIEQLKFDDLKSSVTKQNDTLYVLNFWATWCKPCIDELPYFETSDSVFKNKPLKIILVNLDFNSQMKSVNTFIKKKNIRSTVKHISETNPDLWIEKVDENWSGALPATILFKNGKKKFFKEGPLNEKELTDLLELNLLPEN